MTPAVEAAKRGKVEHTLHSYVHDPAAASYGLEAAELLGLPPAQVFKTLLALVDGSPVVAMVPVDHQLDLKLLARAHGGKKATMCPGDQAQRLTGYVLGGISPLGQKKRLPLYLHERAADWPTLYMSAGRRGLEIEMAPADLLRLTGGKRVALVRD
ncbi:protein ybaK [Alcanivorax hongdengensis A-11-3]|uniref:Cys-tRNA(Pro)/Cys-tRNA(Cys) deacylase n=1 Tax=Alcanivorax hongdengensis A-11-3 TaxID=1177179 RepID=L0WHL5_9GAMM|nr:Cys-tRNA(Pro) deacylase [Alcanivorax hongdengensis]EKF75330.1 protein ybaK [Alcanivorax hongdengensis A-11-3]